VIEIDYKTWKSSRISCSNYNRVWETWGTATTNLAHAGAKGEQTQAL